MTEIDLLAPMWKAAPALGAALTIAIVVGRGAWTALRRVVEDCHTHQSEIVKVFEAQSEKRDKAHEAEIARMMQAQLRSEERTIKAIERLPCARPPGRPEG